MDALKGGDGGPFFSESGMSAHSVGVFVSLAAFACSNLACRTPAWHGSFFIPMGPLPLLADFVRDVTSDPAAALGTGAVFPAFALLPLLA
jgi:hypothetical protein